MNFAYFDSMNFAYFDSMHYYCSIIKNTVIEEVVAVILFIYK